MSQGSALGCGSGSATITNLPTADGTVFQVNGLNSAGQLTGYFTAPGSVPHAFLYDTNGLTDLGTLGGPAGEGIVVNSSGVVAGDSYRADFEFHAFLSSSNGLIDLGTLGGMFSTPLALNESGQVAGVSYLAGNATIQGFFYSDGQMTTVGSLGGGYSYAFSMNSSGTVVGESAATNGDIHAFLYTAGAISDLGTLGSNYSSAASINDSGIIVGQAKNTNGETHAFLYSSNVMNDLGTLGGTSSSAFAVNQNGQVIGGSTTAGDAHTRGFFYSDGAMTDLGTLGGDSITVSALNNSGLVVGDSTLPDGTQHAFVWQHGHLYDLNLFLPHGSGWELATAERVNDAGRIVGFGTNNGVGQPYILDIVLPNNPPVAVAGADQTVECPSQVTLDASGSSDLDGDPLTYEWSLSTTVLGTNVTLVASFPLGTNVVTLKVTDPCGAVGQAYVVVRVVDTTPPTGTCPGPATGVAGSDCQAPVPNLVPLVIASDTCTPQALVITQDPAPGTPLGLGPHTIMLTVTDSSSNQAACGVQFTVSDTTPPKILKTSDPITLSVGTNCQASVPNVLSSVAAVDNCTPADQLVLAQDPAAGTLIGLGQSSIAITVSDASSNTSTATVSLNVVDTTPPVILGTPGPVSLAVGDNCQAVVPNILPNVLASDNCTPTAQLTLAQNPAAGTPIGPGQSSILVSVSDASGNTSSANVALNVVDLTPPTILVTPGPVTLSADANCQGVVPNLLPGVQASDNCTPATQLLLSQNPATGTVVPSGTTTILLTVSDAAGNTSTATVPLSVVDTTAPVILSVPGPITLNVNSNCQAVVPNVLTNVLASDNCTPSAQLLLTQTPTAGSLLGLGSYVITVSASDAAGNSSSAAIPLTVTNVTAPGTYCISASPNVLSPPNHRLVPITVLVTSMTCAPAPTSQIVSVTCNEQTSPNDIQITGDLTVNLAATRAGYGNGRVYTITVRSTDQLGNSSTGTVTVTCPH
jgi:probable HAF family extracellular repeat protein